MSPDKDFFQILSPSLRLLRIAPRGDELVPFVITMFISINISFLRRWFGGKYISYDTVFHENYFLIENLNDNLFSYVWFCLKTLGRNECWEWKGKGKLASF